MSLARSRIVVDLNHHALFSRYWKRALNSGNYEQSTITNGYHFLPGLDIALRTTEWNSIRFIRKHFLEHFTFTRRVFWCLTLFLCAVNKKRFVPAGAVGPLKGDIVLLRDENIVSFDFEHQSVTRQYTKPLAPFVNCYLQFVSLVEPDALVSSDDQHTLIVVPLINGEPLGRRTSSSVKSAAYVHALHSLASIYKASLYSRPAFDYILELRQEVPQQFNSPVFIELCDMVERDGEVPIAITHGDLKDTNILWNGKSCHLIDWEMANHRNVLHDLMNILIHPLLQAKDKNKILLHLLENRTLWQWYKSLSHTLPVNIDDKNKLRQLFILSLLEKYVNIAASGRFQHGEERLVAEWEKTAILLRPYLDEI